MKPSTETPAERFKRLCPEAEVEQEMYIYSKHEFNRVLQRERARADRTDTTFSLVVVNMNELGSADFTFMVQLLQKRTRLTDILGWLDDNRLAVLLYETGLEGARSFTTALTSSVGHNTNANVWQIYIHPAALVAPDKASRSAEQEILQAVSDEAPLALANGAEANTSADAGPMTAQDTPLRYGPAENGLLPMLVKPTPAWKRVMDILFAGTAVILLSPLFILIGTIIYVVSPGPIFFKQTRIGLAGRPFTFWKFRTMKIQAETESHEQHVSDLMKQDIPMAKLDLARDPRIIPLGKVMRASCVDELPQLFNVLIGDMSIVGPRPCLPYEAVHYLPWQSERFLVLPGMTGSWQVNGKNKKTFKEMIRLDIAYARRLSIWSDLKILFKTIPAIIELIREDRAKHAPQAVTEATNVH